jgi:hypothetical protein
MMLVFSVPGTLIWDGAVLNVESSVLALEETNEMIWSRAVLDSGRIWVYHAQKPAVIIGKTIQSIELKGVDLRPWDTLFFEDESFAMGGGRKEDVFLDASKLRK